MAVPSTILISLLLLTMGGVGGWYVQSMQRNTAQTVSWHMATIQAVEHLSFAIGETRDGIGPVPGHAMIRPICKWVPASCCWDRTLAR